MSNMINVDGSDDPFYRYKMPKLVSKVEGRGNGVKTVLVNCSDVAAALHRSSAQVTKYFGCEFGAMTKYEEKIERCLVNGAFENKVLQEALTGYIDKFVLCPKCKNPETIQELKGKKKSAIIYLRCKACGAYEEADNTHKVSNFIVKELSPRTSGSKKEGKKKKAKKGDDEIDSVDENSSEGKDKKKKKKKKKKDKEEKSKKKKKEKKNKNLDDADSRLENGESKDMEEHPMYEGSSSDSDEVASVSGNAGIGEFGMSVEDVVLLNSGIEKVVNFINTNVTEEELIQKVEEIQINSGLRRADRIPMLFMGLFNSSVPLSSFMEKITSAQKIVTNVKDCFLSDEDIQIELMLCLEEAICREDDPDKRSQLRKATPVILKTLYDEDLVEEGVILAWHEQKLDQAKYRHLRFGVSQEEVKLIREASKPIIEWLLEAESDSEESD